MTHVTPNALAYKQTRDAALAEASETSSTPLTFDQDAMNERLKEEHPEVYRDAFAAQRIAAIAGGSIVVSPLTAVLSLGAIATSESAGFDFEAGVPWGIGIGLAVSVVLNIVYLARLRHQKKDQATLLNIARTTYPGARPFISDEAVYFKPV